MNPPQDEWGEVLSVLTVREDEAAIRDFRCEWRGETSCRAELGELVQLLERRRADVAIFLAHPELVGSLVEELQRRQKHVPDMVIAPPAEAAHSPYGRASALSAAEGGDRSYRISVSLSGLSESASPQEILARLYQALRAAQDLGAVGAAEEQTPPINDSPEASAPDEEPASPAPAADAGPQAAGDDRDGGRGRDEIGARLERILEQRLRQQSQP